MTAILPLPLEVNPSKDTLISPEHNTTVDKEKPPHKEEEPFNQLVETRPKIHKGETEEEIDCLIPLQQTTETQKELESTLLPLDFPAPISQGTEKEFILEDKSATTLNPATNTPLLTAGETSPQDSSITTPENALGDFQFMDESGPSENAIKLQQGPFIKQISDKKLPQGSFVQNMDDTKVAQNNEVERLDESTLEEKTFINSLSDQEEKQILFSKRNSSSSHAAGGKENTIKSHVNDSSPTVIPLSKEQNEPLSVPDPEGMKELKAIASEKSEALPQMHKAIHQVSEEFKSAIHEKKQQFSIRLTPPSLGRVSVKLNIHEDGRVIAVVSAEKGETLDVLQKDINTLVESLKEDGINAEAQGFSFNLQKDQSFEEQSAALTKNDFQQSDESAERLTKTQHKLSRHPVYDATRAVDMSA